MFIILLDTKSKKQLAFYLKKMFILVYNYDLTWFIFNLTKLFINTY